MKVFAGIILVGWPATVAVVAAFHGAWGYALAFLAVAMFWGFVLGYLEPTS